MTKHNCPYCDKPFEVATGHYNRQKKNGYKVYCSRKCSGLARRSTLTDKEKKEEKRLYDIEYRKNNVEKLKKKHAEYFKKDYAANPEKYRQIRKEKYKKHLEYLNTPEYKAYKHNYDKKYHSKKKYGEFWESALLVKALEKQRDNYEAKLANGLLSKSQTRERIYK